MKEYIKAPIGHKTGEIIGFLREVREIRGISFRDLAETLGVYPTEVQNWLNPSKNPQIDSIFRVGNALSVSFSMSNSRKSVDSVEQLIDLLNKAKIYYEFSTRELAEMTGITQPSVSSILSHRIMPRLNTFLLLSGALGIELQLSTDNS